MKSKANSGPNEGGRSLKPRARKETLLKWIRMLKRPIHRTSFDIFDLFYLFTLFPLSARRCLDTAEPANFICEPGSRRKKRELNRFPIVRPLCLAERRQANSSSPCRSFPIIWPKCGSALTPWKNTDRIKECPLARDASETTQNGWQSQERPRERDGGRGTN